MLLGKFNVLHLDYSALTDAAVSRKNRTDITDTTIYYYTFINLLDGAAFHCLVLQKRCVRANVVSVTFLIKNSLNAIGGKRDLDEGSFQLSLLRKFQDVSLGYFVIRIYFHIV